MITSLYNYIIRFIFGVDIFISYSRKDAIVYAEKLAIVLQGKGYRCYLDKWKTEPGKKNSNTIVSTLRHSSLFVILGTRNSIISKSVGEEVEGFIKTKRVIVPINFGFSNDEPDVLELTIYDEPKDDTKRIIRRANWYEKFRGFAITDEPLKNLEIGEPSELVINRVVNSFAYQKQSQRLRLVTFVTLGILLILISLIGYSTYNLGKIQTQNSELQGVNKTLTSNNSTLQKESETLTTEKAKLSADLNVLSLEKMHLDTVNTELNIKNTSLSSDNISLVSAQKQLNLNIKDLKVEKDKLNSDLKSLTIQQLLALSQKYLEINPKISLALSKLINDFDSDHSSEVRQLVISALYKNPSYWEVINNEKRFFGSVVPDFQKTNTIFATDTLINNVLYQNSSDEKKIEIKNVSSNTITSNYSLKPNQEFLTPNPIATTLFGIATKTGSTKTVEVFSMYDGFDKEIKSISDVSDIQFSNGNWPCFVLHTNGDVEMITKQNSNQLSSTIIDNKINGYKIEVHPSGKSICVYTSDSKIIWLGYNQSSNSWVKRTLPINVEQNWYYSYRDMANPIIKWGNEPYQVIALEMIPDEIKDSKKAGGLDDNYELSSQIVDLMFPKDSLNPKPKKTGGSNKFLKMDLVAVDAETLSKQILLDEPLFISGLSIPIFVTDNNSTKLLLNIGNPNGGTTPYAFVLNWNKHEKAIPKFSDEGILQGSLKAQSRGNVVCLSVSPNGNYAIVSNDVRGTSATQEGKGLLESWCIYELDRQSSAKPDAAEFNLPDKATVKSIAYSYNSNRVACLDQQNNIRIYNVRDNPLSDEQFFSGEIRFSDSVYDELIIPEPQVVGYSSKLWRINFSGGKVILFNLENGDNIVLNKFSNNERILDVSSNDTTILVVTSQHILKIKNKEIITTVSLTDTAVTATVGNNIIAIKGRNNLTLYDKSSLSEIGAKSIDNSKVFSEIKFDGNWFFKDKSYYTYVTDRQSVDGNISSFSFEEGDSIRLLTRYDFIGNPQNSLTIKKVWSAEIPSQNRDWFSIRRSPTSNVILVLVGNYGTIPKLYQIDIASGKIVNHYLPPNGEWPEMLFEVSDFFSIDNERTGIVFRIVTMNGFNSNQTFGYGIWNERTGSCISWKNLGKGDKYVKRSKDEFLNISFFRINDNDERVKIIDASNGNIVHIDDEKELNLSLENLLNNKQEENDDDEKSKSDVLFIYTDNRKIKIVSEIVKKKLSKELNVGGIEWDKLPVENKLPNDFKAKINIINTQ